MTEIGSSILCRSYCKFLRKSNVYPKAPTLLAGSCRGLLVLRTLVYVLDLSGVCRHLWGLSILLDWQLSPTANHWGMGEKRGCRLGGLVSLFSCRFHHHGVGLRAYAVAGSALEAKTVTCVCSGGGNGPIYVVRARNRRYCSHDPRAIRSVQHGVDVPPGGGPDGPPLRLGGDCPRSSERMSQRSRMRRMVNRVCIALVILYILTVFPC